MVSSVSLNMQRLLHLHIFTGDLLDVRSGFFMWEPAVQAPQPTVSLLSVEKFLPGFQTLFGIWLDSVDEIRPLMVKLNWWLDRVLYFETSQMTSEKFGL
jgi:hypothetical protein